jgi:hypothetical protein
MWRGTARVAALSASLLTVAVPARAQEPAVPGSELVVSLLTMSPGDQSFTKFGHDALLVEDRQTHTSLVYNYGTFVFDSPWLAVDFLKGSLRYWLSVSTLSAHYRHYAAERRSVVSQELRLEPEERRKVADFLARTAASDARYYRYDYYLDNCATRLRDLLDRATHGALSAASRGRARLTYREETLRLTADDVPLTLGLDLAMGDDIDRPITDFAAAFLPEHLAEAVRRSNVKTPDGEEPLLVRERVLLPAPPRPVHTEPPRLWPPLLVAGMAAGALFAGLGALASTKKAARLAFAALLGAAGIAVGALGCLMAGLAAFTDHAVTYHNENLLLCTPWSIALGVIAVGVARGKGHAFARARLLVAFSLTTSAAGLCLKALPWFDQKNFEFIGLFLPAWAGVMTGLVLASPSRARSPSRKASLEASADSRLPAR